MLIKIKKGLHIPINKQLEQRIDDAKAVSRVALIANEFHDLKPAMSVDAGAKVIAGEPLFLDKKYPEIRYTSPASGIVESINRGKRRALQSVVIKVEGDESDVYPKFEVDEIKDLMRTDIVDHLLKSGLWTTLRTRPYSKVPTPDTQTEAIFITAIDTRPLAADPSVIINESKESATKFHAGVCALAHLVDDNVFVCTAADTHLSLPHLNKVKLATFDGPHPAGLAGTHIHFLNPVSTDKTVWTINYQDVMAIGDLFLNGRYPTERVIALAGPKVLEQRLLRTRVGACVSELCEGNLYDDDANGTRIIVGSALDGVHINNPSLDFLGQSSTQVTVLPESGRRHLLGWLRPLYDVSSVSRAVMLNPLRKIKPNLNCLTYGSPRALIPLGLYERILPLRLLATPLLKALLVGDTEMAQKLGCLELDEEDLALCSYVCPSKYEFGGVLRSVLETIEREG